MTYSSSSPAASTLALPNNPTIFSTPSTTTTSTAAMDLNSPLANSHSGVLYSRINQCKNTKNKLKDKSVCTNTNNNDKTYPSTSNTNNNDKTYPSAYNTNNKILINVSDESINDSTTKPGFSFPYASSSPAHQNVKDMTNNTTTNSESLGIQPSRLLTRKSLSNLSNSRSLRNTKNLSLNLNGISNNEVSPERSEVSEDQTLNLNNNSSTNISISSGDNNNNVPITPSLASAKLDLNNSNNFNSGIRPALAINNSTATIATTTTITYPSNGPFSPVNNTALPFRKATLSLSKESRKLSQQNLSNNNSSSICTNNSDFNSYGNINCQEVPIAVQQQQPKLTRRRTMLSLSIPSRTTKASPSLNSAVDFPHRNLGDGSNNNLANSSPTSPTSGVNNVSTNSSNANFNHKNISSSDFLNSASSERTILSDSSSNYGENDMTSVLYRSDSAKYPYTATNNNATTSNNSSNTNINSKNNSDNPITNTFSTQTILQDFSKLTLNDNFDENKLNAYPEGPADIYDGKLFLYSEPTAEQIREFDVVINVAKEIKFPVISSLKSTVYDSISTPENQHGESDFVFEPLLSNKNIYKRVNKHQNNNNYQQAKISKHPDYYYVPWSHTSKLCLDFPVLTNIIDQAIHSKNSKHQNKKVLVHCQCGVSRSASLVIAYIMKLKKMILTEAYSYVKEKANDISPNMTLIFQLMEWGDLIGCGVAKSPGYYDPKFKDQQLGEPERIENENDGNNEKSNNKEGDKEDQGKGQNLNSPGSASSNSDINIKKNNSNNNKDDNNNSTNNVYFERPTASRTLSAKNLDFAKPKISSPLKSSFDDSQTDQNNKLDKREKQQQRQQKIVMSKSKDHISATGPSRANKIFRPVNPTSNSASTTTSTIKPQTLTLSSSNNNSNRPSIMTPLSGDISNFSNANGNDNGNKSGSTIARLKTTTLHVPSRSHSSRNGNNNNTLSLNTPMSASFSSDDTSNEISDNCTTKTKSTTFQLPSLSASNYNRNGVNLALGASSGGSIVSTPLNTSFRLQNKHLNNNNSLNNATSSTNSFINEPPLQTPMMSSFGFSSEEEDKEDQEDNEEEEEEEEVDTENDDTIGTIETTGTTGTVGTIDTIQEEHLVE